MQKAKPTHKVILIQIPYINQILAIDEKQSNSFREALGKIDYNIVGTVNTTLSAKELNDGFCAHFDLMYKAFNKFSEFAELVKLSKEVSTK